MARALTIAVTLCLLGPVLASAAAADETCDAGMGAGSDELSALQTARGARPDAVLLQASASGGQKRSRRTSASSRQSRSRASYPDSSDCPCVAEDPMCCVFQQIRGDGVLVHNLGTGEDVNQAMDCDDEGLNCKIDWYSHPDLINDCNGMGKGERPGTINPCSAWAFFQNQPVPGTQLVPMAYNYPSAGLNHQVALMVDITDQTWPLITRAHVVDGDTWSRLDNGVHVTNWAGGWDKVCPDAKAFKCIPQDPVGEYQCTRNSDSGEYEILLNVGGDGEGWADRFMSADDGSGVQLLDKEITMIQQCEFGPENWDAFVGALDSFYRKAQELQAQGTLSLPDQQTYLEPEINMESSVEELMPVLDGALLAVVAQTNTCLEQVVNLGAAGAKKFCDAQEAGMDETAQIEAAKLAACRLSGQFTTNDRWIPAMYSTAQTNTFVDTESWSCYLSGDCGPVDYLQWLDCCGEGDELAAAAGYCGSGKNQLQFAKLKKKHDEIKRCVRSRAQAKGQQRKKAPP